MTTSGRLSGNMKHALMLLHGAGRFVQEGKGKLWRCAGGMKTVKLQTIESLFARHLVTVCFGGEVRRRHVVKLTPMGRLVAEHLSEQEGEAITFTAPHEINEASAKFIVQVTA